MYQYFLSQSCIYCTGRKASDCVKCGKCEKVCLQHLQIRNLLEDVVKEFEAERA